MRRGRPRTADAAGRVIKPAAPQGQAITAADCAWVFGYGSLMWHPGFPHDEVRVATLYGYHRRFCVYSQRYRGTPERPGLVLGLDKGGCCRGLAFHVPPGEREAAFAYLMEREMLYSTYVPRTLPLSTKAGKLEALCFLVNREKPQYAGHLALEEMVQIILQGEGQRGPCSDYLANTVKHLEALGLGAGHLKDLLKRVETRCREMGRQ